VQRQRRSVRASSFQKRDRTMETAVDVERVTVLNEHRIHSV
jgi:hypothetical protein